MTQRQSPPEEVALFYRLVGKSHVFTSPALRGFHIGSSSLATAYEQAIIALGEHVSQLYECKAEYTAIRFKDFQSHLKGDGIRANVVVATKADCAVAA